MTDEQIFKLETAKNLICDVLWGATTDPKISSTWLSVAGDYCKKVSEEVSEQTKKEAETNWKIIRE